MVERRKKLCIILKERRLEERKSKLSTQFKGEKKTISTSASSKHDKEAQLHNTAVYNLNVMYRSSDFTKPGFLRGDARHINPRYYLAAFSGPPSHITFNECTAVST
jgi:hypothetical protein